MTFLLFLAVVALFVIVAKLSRRVRLLELELQGSGEIEAARRYAVENPELYPQAQVDEPEPAPTPESREPPAAPPPPVDEPVPARLLQDVLAAAARDLPPVVHAPAEREEPEEEDEVAEQTGPARSAGFEDLFGRRLPIWAGGITLLVAAVLMVKYSIDRGLLSPLVRVVSGLLFGTALIGGAEAARRKADVVVDPRIAQALSGAGVGALYAATLAASNLYHLISPGAAFTGLAAITALAMGLALRFGAPSAVLGLVGGLATPALVQTGNPNVPLLCAYLAVVIGALAVLSRRQRWFWLGAMALAGGAGWSAMIIVMGDLSQVATLSAGLLIVLIGLVVPLYSAGDERGVILRALSGLAAAVQIAVLVHQGGYEALTWGLYGVLTLGFVWLSEREAQLRPAMVVPLAAGLLLTSTWPEPPLSLFSAVMAGIVAICGGAALFRLWRKGGGLLEAGQLVVLALAGWFVSSWQFDEGLPGQARHFALLALVFAAIPASAAALGWNKQSRREGASFALLSLASGVLVAIAAQVGLVDWLFAPAMALIAAGVLALSEAAQDRLVRRGSLVFLAASLPVLFVTSLDTGELGRLLGESNPTMPHALLRWTIATAVAGLFAWRLDRTRARAPLQALAALLGYGLIAQVVPAEWLGLASALAAAACTAAAWRWRGIELGAASTVLVGLGFTWGMEPFFRWLIAAAGSLMSMPMLVKTLPAPAEVLRRLLAPAAVIAAVGRQARGEAWDKARQPVLGLAGAFALVSLHVFYKHLFHIADMTAFERLGLAERTLWEALLVGAGLLAARQWPRANAPALVAVAAGLLHNFVYTLLLHDPLWSDQHVGPWPLANLLIPAFAFALLADRLVREVAPKIGASMARSGDVLRMIALVLLAYASLRQLFHGTLLTAPGTGSAENIARSVLAVALALGYLGWGIHSGRKDWRIASLVLMLAAVGKVFLFDASGLEGLFRIASFLALGFSLIGIGWLYSRYLKPGQEP